MRTIWKFPIPYQEQFIVATKAGAKPVLIALQDGKPHLWLEVDKRTLNEVHYIYNVVGTGHDIPERGEHVGSWQDGSFVWHLYKLA